MIVLPRGTSLVRPLRADPRLGRPHSRRFGLSAGVLFFVVAALLGAVGLLIGVHATAAEWSAAALDATRVPRAVAV